MESAPARDTARCTSCGSEMSSEAVFCPNCDRPQSGLQQQLNRRPHWLRTGKWLSGTLLIPAAIFVAGSLLSMEMKSAEHKTRQLEGFSTLLPEIEHHYHLLYETACSGVPRQECVEYFQQAVEGYQLARLRAATFVVTNFPAYVGAVELLDALAFDAIYEARQSWARYISCVYDQSEHTPEECYEDRLRYAYPSLDVSGHVISVLRCAIQKSLAAELDIVCRAMLDELYEPLVIEPRALLSSHDGIRQPPSLLEYSRTLFDKLILPGSGLVGSGTQAEPGDVID